MDCRVDRRQQGRPASRSANRSAFRADLYYRLGVAFIELPPLRERREDIPLLFEHFMLQAARRYDRAGAHADDSTQLGELMAHAWPGNVRELRNVADRFVLGLARRRLQPAARPARAQRSLPEQIEHFERALITESLRRQHGEVALRRNALGVPKQTLYDKLRRLHIDATEFRAGTV